MLTKEQMIAMLRADVIPALGCTEPVCVALAAANASKAAGGKVLKMTVSVNANIYKKWYVSRNSKFPHSRSALCSGNWCSAEKSRQKLGIVARCDRRCSFAGK
jgi:hypothetical protein